MTKICKISFKSVTVSLNCCSLSEFIAAQELVAASLSNEAKPRPKSEFWKIVRDLDFGGGGGNDLGGAVAANARSVAGVFLTLGYCEGNEFKT